MTAPGDGATVAVLHAALDDTAAPDAKDALVEAEAVSEALAELGYTPVRVGLSLDLGTAVETLRRLAPAFVFNLVEDVAGDGRLVTLSPLVLEHLRLPYTGSGLDATHITTNKMLTKQFLQGAGIATPPAALFPGETPFEGPYIVKAVWEEASVGLDEHSVAADREALAKVAAQLDPQRAPYFVEGYVDGREFAVSVIDGPSGPEVLPIPETVFEGFAEGKPRIVGYRAKWDTTSFEYIHTVRKFELRDEDRPLLGELAELSLRCWHLFGLRGYARVDYRVDPSGRPWVLEINTNPCISPDAGFVAAAERAGIGLTQVVERIVRAALFPLR